MALIVLSLAWVLGVWLGSHLAPSPLWFLAAAVPLLFFGLCRWRGRLVVVCLAIVLLSGGALFFQSSRSDIDESHIGWYVGDTVFTIEGTVSRMPEEKEKSQALRLADITIGTGDGMRDVSGAVLVYVSPFPEYHYGDRITVTGKLLDPPVFDTFDWRAYLVRDEVFATVLYPSVMAVELGHGNPILSAIYSLRERLADGLAAALPEPHASLAQGLTLGIRSNIASDVKESFAISGTSHLLAISGLHLGIIAGAVLIFARGLLGRRGYWYVWLAMAAIWGFVILSGLAPPVVRGAIMASVFLLAEFFGRQKSALPALCLAAAVMVAANPQVLWSASFQMSFAAMAGLVFLLPPLTQVVRRLTARFPGEGSRFHGIVYIICEGFAVTAAAVAGVLPLIAYYFGSVSLVGGIATLTAMPVVPLVIFGALLTGTAGIINPILAVPFAAITWLGLAYLLVVVEFFARVPALSVVNFDSALVWGCYALLTVATWGLNRWQRRQDALDSLKPVKLGFSWKLAVPSMVLVVVLASTGLIAPVDHRLQVSFLDVGQGDAIYIRTPAGQDILIDGGPSPQRLAQELGKKMPFWNRTIELVVSTHADADHLTGLVEALERWDVKQIVHPGVPSDTDLYSEWQRLIDEKSIPETAVSAGQNIRLAGGLEFEVLNPFDGNRDTNAASLVMSLKYDDLSFLFTGDLPVEGELELIYRRLVPDSTVLKVAHHGSGGSSSVAFLSVARPELAVIPVGKNNYGHPTPEVVAALGSWCIDGGIYRTDTSGTVTFITDGRVLWLESD
ncbi:DNA internalization-related competence protein ComEC/Rec2 [Dehalogenimonas sp. THU2]|uniref:DNA internalization-related competence protein ComEC/Rec2 n=1 Tax=Dehalogenimonas sp. THU2 TaxID=3151121 RepID=UPI003218325B